MANHTYEAQRKLNELEAARAEAALTAAEGAGEAPAFRVTEPTVELVDGLPALLRRQAG